MAKVVTTRTLKSIAEEGRKAGLNRVLPVHLEERLDPDGKHVISDRSMLHGDGQCIRCFFMLKLKDEREAYDWTMDVPIDRYNKLREYAEEVIN